MLENQYNNRTLNVKFKDLMYKAEIKYNNIKETLKLKGNSKAEDPILELKYEIKELKAVAKATNTKCVVPEKGSGRYHDITYRMNIPPKNGKL